MVELVGSFYRILDKLVRGTDVRLIGIKNLVKSINSVIIIYISDTFLHFKVILTQVRITRVS